MLLTIVAAFVDLNISCKYIVLHNVYYYFYCFIQAHSCYTCISSDNNKSFNIKYNYIQFNFKSEDEASYLFSQNHVMTNDTCPRIGLHYNMYADERIDFLWRPMHCLSII